MPRFLQNAFAPLVRLATGLAGWVPAAGLLLGCASQRVPDPKVTARTYASAAQRGDADAVYALLTPEGQRALGRAGTKQLVRESKAEIGRTAKAVQGEDTRVEASAETRFSDGESATLVLEDG